MISAHKHCLTSGDLASSVSFFFVVPLSSYRPLNKTPFKIMSGCSHFTVLVIPVFLDFLTPSLAAFCTLGSTFSALGFASLTLGASLRQDKKKLNKIKSPINDVI